MIGLVVGQIVLTLIGQRRSKNWGEARGVQLTDLVNKVGVIQDVADKVDVIKQEVKDDHGVRKDVGRLADAAVDDRETHRTDIARVDGELKDLRRRTI